MPSETNACSTWLSIGSLKPASAPTRDVLPATARPIFFALMLPRVVSMPVTRPSVMSKPVTSQFSMISTPRIAAPRAGVALRVRMIEVEHAALAHHRIIVEILLQPFPQLHRPFVERLVARQQVVRADDGGVAAGIAG